MSKKIKDIFIIIFFSTLVSAVASFFLYISKAVGTFSGTIILKTITSTIIVWTGLSIFLSATIIICVFRKKKRNFICSQCEHLIQSEKVPTCPNCSISMVPLEGFFENKQNHKL